jgi:Outer membrane protein beta-barrel domain
MKKRIVSIFVFVSFFTNFFGQTNFGVKAGFNLSAIGNYQFSEQDKAIPGMNYGILAVIKVGEKIFIQPELLYSAKGFKFSETAYTVAGSLRLSYLSIPILGGFQASDRFAILAGLEFGYLTKADSKPNSSSRNIARGYQRFDVAVDLGMAYRIKKYLAVECRYSHGTQSVDGSILAPSVIDFVGIHKATNRVFQMGMCYIFQKKRKTVHNIEQP